MNAEQKDAPRLTRINVQAGGEGKVSIPPTPIAKGPIGLMGTIESHIPQQLKIDLFARYVVALAVFYTAHQQVCWLQLQVEYMSLGLSDLSESTLNTAVVAVTVEILGLVAIIVKYLFGGRSASAYDYLKEMYSDKGKRR